MEDIFDIRNNFIPKKAQEEKSGKFGRELGRNGKMIPPSLEGATEAVSTMASNQVDLGTESIVDMGSEQAIDNTAVPPAPVLGQVPVPAPIKQVQKSPADQDKDKIKLNVTLEDLKGTNFYTGLESEETKQVLRDSVVGKINSGNFRTGKNAYLDGKMKAVRNYHLSKLSKSTSELGLSNESKNPKADTDLNSTAPIKKVSKPSARLERRVNKAYSKMKGYREIGTQNLDFQRPLVNDDGSKNPSGYSPELSRKNRLKYEKARKKVLRIAPKLHGGRHDWPKL